MSLLRWCNLRPARIVVNSIRIASCRRKSTQNVTLDTGGNQWKSVIGLEIHAQISSASKLFSGSNTEFGVPVNTQVAFLDAALPGTLPVLNSKCVKAAIMTALALNCKINKTSKFDRKHYFYADLPTGYQITQQRQPIAVGGHLNYVAFNKAVHRVPIERTVNITQIQLEQDSGKSMHDEEAGYSLIDLNRAGVGLMEIVTEPDFSDGEEAAGFIKELQLILQTLGTCDGKMDEGSLRVDANISVHKPGEPYGIRTEVKNINSIRNVAKAISFEIKRQIKDLNNGYAIVNETRTFDADLGETLVMRDKERLQDYRFMPEPNLPPLRVYDSDDKVIPDKGVVNIDNCRKAIPKLPADKRSDLMSQYGLSMEHCIYFVNEPDLCEFFINVVTAKSRNGKIVVNLLLNEFLGRLNARDINISQSPVTTDAFGELVDLLESKLISMTTAKKLLDIMFEGHDVSPITVVHEKNWAQIVDKGKIEEVCKDVLIENPNVVQQYKKGKVKVLKFLIGQVHRKFNGQADPILVSEAIKKLISD